MKFLGRVPKSKLIRVCLGWSQKRLAKELNVSQSLVSSLENQLVTMTPAMEDRLNAVAQAHAVSLDQGGQSGN